MTIKISNNLSLANSYIEAERIMKKHAVSFYSAFKLLPLHKFESVTAVYAFCRHSDDSVDIDSGSTTAAKISILDVIDRNLREIYNITSENWDFLESLSQERLWWLAFKDTIEKYSIPYECFSEQLKGQRLDLLMGDIKDRQELIEYSKLVAGSVGKMLLPIIATDKGALEDQGFTKACEDLGVGMQIANILRDVGEDMRNKNRIYIPAEMLVNYRIERSYIEKLSHSPESESILEEITPQFITMWEDLAEISEHYFESFLNYFSFIDKECLLPVVTSALSYKAIIDAVRAENFNCFTKRCYTTKEQRQEIFVKAQNILNEDK